jgi:hypothetical protein
MIIPSYVPDDAYIDPPKHIIKRLVEMKGSFRAASLSIEKSDDFLRQIYKNGKRLRISDLKKILALLKCDYEINYVYPKLKKKPILIPRNTETKEICRIIGHILGDGCIDKSFTVRYKNTKKELIKSFENDMMKVFGEGSKNDERVGNSTYSKTDAFEIRFSNVCGKTLHNMFGQFAYRKNEKYIPRKIFEYPDELKLCLLSAFIDDEGSVLQRRIAICQEHFKLVEDLIVLLKSLKLSPSVRDKTCDKASFVYNNRYYSIEMYGCKDLQFLSKSLELRHPEKIKRLSELGRRYLKIKFKRRKNELEKEIISFFEEVPKASSTEISKIIKADKETVRKKLVKLRERNIVKRIGNGGKTKYELFLPKEDRPVSFSA